MANFDPRTGRQLAEGTTQDFSNFRGSFNYDQNTGRPLSPIAVDQLNNRPRPLALTAPRGRSMATGFSSEMETSAANFQDQYTQRLQERANQSEKGRNTALEDYLTSLASTPGEVELTDQAYRQTVDPIEAELLDINKQISAEIQANRRKIQAMEKNPTGMLAGALADEIERVNDESLARQADLSVIQMGVQGRYDSAKAIADRAVQVQLERRRNLNEALKLNYEANKEEFTRDEQRAFQTAQANRERELNRQERDLQQISDMSITALQNGAPSAVAAKMRQAKTVEEAMRIGGQYIMSYSERIKKLEYNQLVNSSSNSNLTEKQRKELLSNPTAKQAAARIGVINAVKEYAEKYERYSSQVNSLGQSVPMARAQRKELETALNTTVGSAINVAQGQGAMGDAEANRILGNLKPGAFKNVKTVLSSANGVVDAQNSLLQTDFDFIDSAIPGATDNFDVFSAYKIQLLPPEQRVVEQKMQAYNAFKDNNFSDQEIIDYFSQKDPVNANIIQTLYSQGYEIEEILRAL